MREIQLTTSQLVTLILMVDENCDAKPSSNANIDRRVLYNIGLLERRGAKDGQVVFGPSDAGKAFVRRARGVIGEV